MGNILAGALTGVFIYITDAILQTFTGTSGGIMDLIKFIIQGWLTVIFVNSVENFTGKST